MTFVVNMLQNVLLVKFGALLVILLSFLQSLSPALPALKRVGIFWAWSKVCWKDALDAFEIELTPFWLGLLHMQL